MMPLLKIELKYEHDVVLARQRARQIAALCGFDVQDQVRIATALSELARNAFRYAGGGLVEYAIEDGDPQALWLKVNDQGPGIADLGAVLEGQYRSKTGMGLGLIGVQRLMDCCDIESAPETGTQVQCAKFLPKHAHRIGPKEIGAMAGQLAQHGASSPFEEMQRQNQELLAAMTEVQKQRAELTQLNQELEETNRGVVALYAELDERAEELRRVSELKTQFLSNMTHEFRTPLNSMRSIAQMLLDHMDGELTREQTKQVGFIKSATIELSTLVNDLLDLAKVEAGKVTVQPSLFFVRDLFGTLRGMLKPLLDHAQVNLIFDEPVDIPAIENDEGKIAQILRNFISNGLKYTRQGEVRISAQVNGARVTFHVRDTGIGIAEADQSRIFEEFVQIEGRHQEHAKGTGLGLSLSRNLAELLGGFVAVESKVGQGSVFSVTLPLEYRGPQEASLTREAPGLSGLPQRLLLIDDNETDRYVLARLLGDRIRLIEATDGAHGLEEARRLRPDLVILDLSMPGLSGLEVLQRLRQDEDTSAIPVIIHSSKVLAENERAELAGLATAIVPKSSLSAQEWSALIASLASTPTTSSQGAAHG